MFITTSVEGLRTTPPQTWQEMTEVRRERMKGKSRKNIQKEEARKHRDKHVWEEVWDRQEMDFKKAIYISKPQWNGMSNVTVLMWVQNALQAALVSQSITNQCNIVVWRQLHPQDSNHGAQINLYTSVWTPIRCCTRPTCWREGRWGRAAPEPPGWCCSSWGCCRGQPVRSWDLMPWQQELESKKGRDRRKHARLRNIQQILFERRGK